MVEADVKDDLRFRYLYDQVCMVRLVISMLVTVKLRLSVDSWDAIPMEQDEWIQQGIQHCKIMI